MKIVIIGGVAAGMSAAAKARREDKDAEIVVYEKGEYLSYGACGMPYYIGGRTRQLSDLIVRTKEEFEKSGIRCHLFHEVLSVDSASKTIEIRDINGDRIITETYDKLMIATGAAAVIPPFEGSDLKRVMSLKVLEDGINMKKETDNPDVRQITIVGGGYIGIELAETFVSLGKKVRIIELLDRILMPFESEISGYAHDALTAAGGDIRLKEKVVRFLDRDGDGVVDCVETDKGTYDTDLVVVSVGVRPNTAFLKESGIELAKNGAVQVDRFLRTSVPDIYAAGDCAMVYHRQKKENVFVPLATTANKCGKLAGINMCGGNEEFGGALGAGAIKVLNIEMARVGLGEEEAKQYGYDAASKVVVAHNRPNYCASNFDVTFKVIYDKKTKEILGAQGVGEGDIVFRINTFVVAITNKMKTYELGMVDFCYAPPFNSAWDAVHVAVNAIK